MELRAEAAWIGRESANSASRDAICPARLLGPQRFDGIEIGGFPGGVVAEGDPDQRGKEDRQQHGARANGGGPTREAGNDG